MNQTFSLSPPARRNSISRGNVSLAKRNFAVVLGCAVLGGAAFFAMRARHAAVPVVADLVVPTGGINFYVATDGNDGWSGRLTQPGADGGDGPFATIERARDAIRALRARGERRAATVSLRGGTYFLSKPLVLETEDSGTPAAPVTYRAFGTEKVTLSGGRRIGGWRRVGNIYKTQLPEVAAGRWNFNALFGAGARATRACTPNKGEFFNIVAPGGAGFEPGSPPTYSSFRFRAGDVDANWSNLRDIEVVSNRRASQSRARIAQVNGDRVVLQSLASKHYGWEEWNKGQDRYYLENVAEGLDSPGEWHLDRQTGTLSLWPLPGQNLATTPVIAPVLQQLLDVRGDAKTLDIADRPFTVSTWVKTSATGTIHLVSDWFPDVQHQMTARNASALNGTTLGVSQGRMMVGIGDYLSPVEIGFLGNGINDGRWHNLVAVFDRASRRIVGYIDGAPVGTFALSRTFENLRPELPVLLGDFAKQPYEASLDEVLIVGRALNADEVAALQRGIVPTTNIELNMNFEGNVRDAASNRTAQITGALTYVAGARGQALHRAFDARAAQDDKVLSHAAFSPVAQNYVRNISFQNLTWSHTATNLIASGYPGHQSAMFLTDKPAIHLQGAADISLKRNTVSHVGGHGIALRFSQRITLDSNEVFDAAANGIMVAGGSDNTIIDNSVHNIGATFSEGAGIIVGIEGAVSGDNRIAHNAVFQVPHTGISVGMTWRTTDFNQNNNITESNYISRAMQELNDGGGIYSNGYQRQSIIRNNLLLDIHDEARTDLHRDAGIYLDNGSKDITVSGNAVVRAGTNLLLNDTHGTSIQNNVFVDGLKSQAFLFNEMVSFKRNIIYYTSATPGTLLFWPGSGDAIMAKKGGESDFNLYFDRARPQIGDELLRGWRNITRGDLNGRIADPQFTDFNRDDFSLRPGSPARALGFVPVNFNQVGPRQLYPPRF